MANAEVLAQKIAGQGDGFDIKFSDLENLQDLSSGNFGKVYKATYLGTQVAVKKLLDVDDEFMHKYIEREMGILRTLRHPNIVQFMGLSRHSSGLYIVTEFVPGGDLRHLLKDEVRDLGWKTRVKMALDTVAAITYVHSKGCIHRDLKSHNLLVDDSSRIKICDFGFSRKVGDAEEPMTLCGTDEWMAPEVMLGEKYDAKADVFSFGMVLTELITRQKPAKRNPGAKFAVDLEALKKLVPKNCPPDFFTIALECIVWDPDRRPLAKEIMDKLKALHDSLPEDVPAKAAGKKSQNVAGEMNYGTSVEVEDNNNNNNKVAEPVKQPEKQPEPAPVANANPPPATNDAPAMQRRESKGNASQSSEQKKKDKSEGCTLL